jgi:DNA-binding MarR family transcriptional regulator
METGINHMDTLTNRSLVIRNALLGFKGLANKISNDASNHVTISNLGLYVLISLFNEKPLLRNDLMKRLKINYYDAGKALDQLIRNNHVIFEVFPERSNLKKLSNKRKRYRLSLKGVLFVEDIFESIN